MTPDLFERFRSFQIFKDCPDDFLQWLVTQSHHRTTAAGTEILSAGKANDRLFLLINGELSVMVDGERVASLNTPGDLIGEISVLTASTSSATVTAITPVEYLEVMLMELNPNENEKAHDYGFYLFRALACSLSAKITRTNQKARQFEIANRQLFEFNGTLEKKVLDRTRDLQRKTEELEFANNEMDSRNTELLASHRQLEELYKTKDITFQKLDTLESECLTPLRTTLKALELKIPENKRLVEVADRQIDASIALLKPFSQLHTAEEAIRSQKILLVENDRKQHTIAKLALSGSGAQLDFAASEEEALALVDAGKRFDLIFISSALASALPMLHQRLPGARFVFIVSCKVPTELPALKQHADQISNIVSRNPEDRAFTVKNIGTTVAKLVAKDIFGIEKYLLWGVEVKSHAVSSSKDRKQIIADMTEHFSKLGVRSTMSEIVGSVTEELLMNAIYDAPISPDGTHLYNQLPRTTVVDLKPSEHAEIRYACDGILAAVSVSDPFGGFKMRTLINYLEKNFSPDLDNSQENGKGGGGLGLHQIVVNSDMVVFNVRRGVRTEVIALFNLDQKVVLKDSKPTFHYFFQN